MIGIELGFQEFNCLGYVRGSLTVLPERRERGAHVDMCVSVVLNLPKFLLILKSFSEASLRWGFGLR